MDYVAKQLALKKKATDFIKKNGKARSYDFATWILNNLSKKGFCIWQSYTKEDLADNLGHNPSIDEMEDLGDALQCFENIRM